MYVSALPSDVGPRDKNDIANLARAGVRANGLVAISSIGRNGSSIRKRVREEGSLRVRFPREYGSGLSAVLVNTGGGMTGGDNFSISATAEAESNLSVTTAAAEKIYRSAAGDAIMAVRLRVENRASMIWLPQESILFDRSRLRRTYDVSLASDAVFLSCEITCVGRNAMGETVRNLYLNDRWTVRRDDRVLFADAVRVDGDAEDILERPHTANGARCFATMLHVSPQPDEAAAVIRALVNRQDGVSAGVGLVNGICVARFVASSAGRLRATIAACATSVTEFRLPRSWNT